MVPLGLGQAATVRVGLAYGARNALAIAHAGWCAFGLTLAYAALSATAMIAAPRYLIAPFIDVDAPENANAVVIAVALLKVGGGLPGLRYEPGRARQHAARAARFEMAIRHRASWLLGDRRAGRPCVGLLDSARQRSAYGSDSRAGLPSSPFFCCALGRQGAPGFCGLTLGPATKDNGATSDGSAEPVRRRGLTHMTDHSEPLVLDVDTGIDDAFALLYACAHNASANPRRLHGRRQRFPRGRDAQHASGSRPCGAGGHPGLAGRGDRDLDCSERRERDSRRDRPRPCGFAGARRSSPRRAARRGYDHRRGARAFRAPHPVRGGAIDEYRARGDARARTAAPRQAVRHHGRRLFRIREM